jgi:scyllo-inositol 2-dehydrogenase (NADP+)
VRLFDRVEGLLEQAPGALVVAAPNRHHGPIALEAIAAGVPVVVDKPLAAGADEARRIVAAARDAGVLLAVFHNRRWDGDFLTVSQLVEAGDLGPVVRFESRFERWRPQVAAGRWRELADPAEGGGLLLDLGSHLVDQAIVLFGAPTAVYAEIGRRRPDAAVDDDVFVALEHADAIVSHLWMSMVAAQPGPRFRVLGLEGAYTKYGLDPQEQALAAGDRPGRSGWGREPRECWGSLVAGAGPRPVETQAGAYEAFYVALERALRGDGPPPVTGDEAVAVLDVLEAARRSAQARELVVL